jgi:hypothetical protein
LTQEKGFDVCRSIEILGFLTRASSSSFRGGDEKKKKIGKVRTVAIEFVCIEMMMNSLGTRAEQREREKLLMGLPATPG